MEQGPYERRRRSSREAQASRVSPSGHAYRPALGRTQELQERERARREGRWGSEDADVYDPRSRRVYPGDRSRRPAHRVFWAFVCLLCVICLATLGLLVAPQLLGVRFYAIPNYAFVNGAIITFDQTDYDQYLASRNQAFSDTIMPGVFIDGQDMGGLTLDEARSMLDGVEASGGGDFSISVNIDGQSWLIDSRQVPMTRNVDEMLRLAWSYGRQNTADIRGTRITPFQERLNARQALPASPVLLATTLSYDSKNIRAITDQIAASVTVAPVNASVMAFDFEHKSFSFSTDVSGTYLDPDELYERVMSRLQSGDVYGSISMQPQTVLADVTKAELMSSLCRISTYTTKTTDNKNRNTNVQLSANAISGMVINPGEVFSFNAATGERTPEKGYKPASAISGGQVNDEVGGGVCQTSSTLFNAAARANLEIITRSPHAWPSSYVPEGMDATVNWPGLDFKFRNNTDYPIYIVSWYKDRRVTVELYGMGLGDGVTIDLEHKKVNDLKAPNEIKEVQNASLPAGTRKKTVSRRDGSVWETYQVWYKNGAEFKRVLLCKSTYKAYQETYEYN